VEQVHQQRAVCLIGHVFQLTHATIPDALIQEKVPRCNGCTIQHPSQRQYSCLLMDSEDAWFYFRDIVVEKMNLNDDLKIAGSVCNTLGFKLGKSLEAYASDLAKMPWTSLYLTSPEMNSFGEIAEAKQLQDLILHFGKSKTLICLRMVSRFLASPSSTCSCSWMSKLISVSLIRLAVTSITQSKTTTLEELQLSSIAITKPAKQEKGRPRGQTVKLCEKIVGYDANTLYLWAIMQDIPTGSYTRCLAGNEFKPKSSIQMVIE